MEGFFKKRELLNRNNIDPNCLGQEIKGSYSRLKVMLRQLEQGELDQEESIANMKSGVDTLAHQTILN